MHRFLERLLRLLRVRRPDRDLAREIDAHLSLLQDADEARGLPPEAARRAARFLFIGVVASIVPAGQAVGAGWRRALQED